ncbi:hypothetical protein BU16DRAFT_565729 [Lophium mytilinum]|uniref:F-box domain-containing protein n=1 Tax=Lophium mytilinum TaxID=390894 RepID=A0A6A6QEH2_9PEZI|nr:hypothetical protein BU16DRAFT_565729 [Lophium mytilinum]
MDESEFDRAVSTFIDVNPCRSIVNRTSDEDGRSLIPDDISHTDSVYDDFDQPDTSLWYAPITTLACALLELDRTLDNVPDEQIAVITFAKKLEKPIPRYRNLRITTPGLERWIAVLERHKFYRNSSEQAKAATHIANFSSTVPLFLPALQRIYRSAIMGKNYINSPRGDSKEHFGVGNKDGINCSGVLAALPEIDRILKTQHAPRVQKRLQSVKPFPFLSLPKDIRLIIYEHVLKSDHAIPLPDWIDEQLRGLRFSMSLLTVSRSVHDEAAAVFYGYNTFIVKSLCVSSDLKIHEQAFGVPIIREVRFLVNLDMRYRSMIKKMEWMIRASSVNSINAPCLDLAYEDMQLTLSQLTPHLRSLVFFFETNWCRGASDPLYGSAEQLQGQKDRLRCILKKHAKETQHIDRVGWDFGHCNEFVDDVVAEMRQAPGDFEEVESVHNCVNDAVVAMLMTEYPDFF